MEPEWRDALVIVLRVVALLDAVSVHLVLRFLLLLEILLHEFFVLLPDLARGGVLAVSGIVCFSKSRRDAAAAAQCEQKGSGGFFHKKQAITRMILQQIAATFANSLVTFPSPRRENTDFFDCSHLNHPLTVYGATTRIR